MYYHEAEGWSRDQIEKHQVKQLRSTLEQASRSRFYGDLFKKSGVEPEQIKTVDDIRRLPFTTKQDLREAYPDGLNAAPKEDLVRMHVSSGTTGTPVVVTHTAEDLDWWASLVARCMYMVGVRPADTFQNMSGYGLFTGGLGIHCGAEKLGCLTIPAGAGNTARQIKLIRDFGVSVVHIIPSYALYLANTLKEKLGVDPKDLGLRIALVGAEPYTEEARGRLEDLFGMKVYNSYGLSEMNGPGVAFECIHQRGMHLWEDAYLAEIIDPATGEQLPDGETGELVMTSLGRRGMPVIRYRTRDLTRFMPSVCTCGRFHRRLDRIKGRADDMMIIKGVNIYPMQIETVLMSTPEVGQNYQIILEREKDMDNIRIKVEIKDAFFEEDMRVLTGLQKRIAARLRDEILVTPCVDLVERNSLPQSEGKAQRVIDKRGES